MMTSCALRPFTFVTGLLFCAQAFAADAKHFTTQQLPNGLELVAMESHKTPLTTIVLAVKAGAMTETSATNGLTHLWEHMFFKGNKTLANQEAFNRRVRQLGLSFNGDTSAEMVRYYFSLPSAFLDEGLQFMADAISTPLLEKSELERERQVVLNEYERNASQPNFDLGQLIQRILYGDLDYRRDSLGSRPIIEKATREQLLKIKDEVFVPQNSALLISGDFEPKTLLTLVNKHFAAWKNPPKWQPIVPPPFPAFPATTEVVMTRKQVQNVSLYITYNGPKGRTQPQDTFAADVLTGLLAHLNGKFYKKFVDSGLTLGSSFGYYTQSQTGEIGLSAQTTPEKIKQVKDQLLAEVKEWTKEDYFTSDQLEDVRRSLLINHKRELNKPSDYIKSLAFWWAITGLDYYSTYLDNLRKTDMKSVRTFVQNYLIDKPHVTSILLSPDGAKAAKIADNSAELLKKYNIQPTGN